MFVQNLPFPNPTLMQLQIMKRKREETHWSTLIFLQHRDIPKSNHAISARGPSWDTSSLVRQRPFQSLFLNKNPLWFFFLSDWTASSLAVESRLLWSHHLPKFILRIISGHKESPNSFDESKLMPIWSRGFITAIRSNSWFDFFRGKRSFQISSSCVR